MQEIINKDLSITELGSYTENKYRHVCGGNVSEEIKINVFLENQRECFAYNYAV